MSIIPLHLQRRIEQRWAARFGSREIQAVPGPDSALQNCFGFWNPGGYSISSRSHLRRPAVAEQTIRFEDGAALMGIWSRLVDEVFLHWLAPPPAQRRLAFIVPA
jgi:hypothetical protein